jgi:indole-3-glycerol phosphate synthase
MKGAKPMFLERILARQAVEVARRKAECPQRQLWRALEAANPELRPFEASLGGDAIRLIAEVKKASPSKGLLCPNFNLESLANAYEAAGAAAISVLTETEYFLGSLDDLKRVKACTTRPPVLRKDFIIDPYQLVEARYYGADAVLLIVVALDQPQLGRLLDETRQLGMTPLVEVHGREEVRRALDAGASVVGINNRDLRTFTVTLDVTYQLLPELPTTVIKVSESGIVSRDDLKQLENAGVNAVLIGESLVRAADPAAKVRELLGGV